MIQGIIYDSAGKKRKNAGIIPGVWLSKIFCSGVNARDSGNGTRGKII